MRSWKFVVSAQGKWVLMAFSNVSSDDIENDTDIVLGFHHSGNKRLTDERNFLNMVTDIHNVLNLWKMRGISLIGKILIFKTKNIKASISCIYGSGTRKIIQ